MKNYLINQVDRLLQGNPVTMLLGGDKFIIHKLSESCDPISTPEHDNDTFSGNIHPAKEFALQMYPKQKYLHFVIDKLVNKNLLDSDLYFFEYPNLHLADVCAFFNNRFGKPKSTHAKFIKLCKFLQENKIQFPMVSIKNPVAKKYVC